MSVSPLIFKLSAGEYLAVKLGLERVIAMVTSSAPGGGVVREAEVPPALEAKWWHNVRHWHDVDAFELARLQLTIGVEVSCRFCNNGIAPDMKSTCLQCKGKAKYFDRLESLLAFGKVVRTARLLTPQERRWFYKSHGHPWGLSAAQQARELERERQIEEAAAQERAVELERREHVADDEHTRDAYTDAPNVHPWERK